MTTTEKLDLAYLKLRTALHLYQKSPTDLDPTQLVEVEHAVRQQYDHDAHILASGQANSLTLSPEQVETVLADLQHYYPSEHEFQAELTKLELSSQDLREAITRQLQVENLLTSPPVPTVPTTPISEIDAKIYYYMHLDQFNLPETRTTRHILIGINSNNPENTRRAARKRLFNIAVRIRRKPQSFAEQARKHSESNTAAQGGLLGRIPRGTLPAELDEVLFSLQEQEISKIVETTDGFHLLLCEHIHPPGQLSFEEAQPTILELLQQRHHEVSQPGNPEVENG